MSADDLLKLYEALRGDRSVRFLEMPAERRRLLLDTMARAVELDVA